MDTPRVLCSKRRLQDALVPVLCLQDALHDQGFVGKPELLWHDPADVLLYFDNRKLQTRRSYLQAVLARLHIFAKGGDVRFRSGRTSTCYQWLVRCPGPLRADQTTKEMQKMLEDIDAKSEVHAPTLAVLAIPARAPRDVGALGDDVDGPDDEPPRGRGACARARGRSPWRGR